MPHISVWSNFNQIRVELFQTVNICCSLPLILSFLYLPFQAKLLMSRICDEPIRSRGPQSSSMETEEASSNILGRQRVQVVIRSLNAAKLRADEWTCSHVSSSQSRHCSPTSSYSIKKGNFSLKVHTSAQQRRVHEKKNHGIVDV